MEYLSPNTKVLDRDRMHRWLVSTFLYWQGDVIQLSQNRQTGAQGYRALTFINTVEGEVHNKWGVPKVEEATFRELNYLELLRAPNIGAFPDSKYINIGEIACAYGYRHPWRQVNLGATVNNFRFKFPPGTWGIFRNRSEVQDLYYLLRDTNLMFKLAYQPTKYPTSRECFNMVDSGVSISQAFSPEFAFSLGEKDAIDIVYKGFTIVGVTKNYNDIKPLNTFKEYNEKLEKALVYANAA